MNSHYLSESLTYTLWRETGMKHVKTLQGVDLPVVFYSGLSGAHRAGMLSGMWAEVTGKDLAQVYVRKKNEQCHGGKFEWSISFEDLWDETPADEMSHCRRRLFVLRAEPTWFWLDDLVESGDSLRRAAHTLKDASEQPSSLEHWVHRELWVLKRWKWGGALLDGNRAQPWVGWTNPLR